jgi:putative mRNA 3-end processing factor
VTAAGLLPGFLPRAVPHDGIPMVVPARSHPWIKPGPAGLYVEPGDFWIDPVRPVGRAVVTHGHSDHAYNGHGRVLATEETLAVMRLRFGEVAGEAVRYGETVSLGDIAVTLLPAGHVLGSAQVQLEHGGQRVVVSGDYKRRRDPTCAPFLVTSCDLFISEATFALPVFKHPDDAGEIQKILRSLALFPDRTHLIGAYVLGKAQRIIMLLREAGYDAPIYIHGALHEMCALYQRFGLDLGALRAATSASPKDLKGQIVIAPPGALADRWSRRMPDAVVAMASGWMRIRQRAKQQRVELPLVISDHADWDELLMTLKDVAPSALWITHGREEALVHAAQSMGLPARALSLTGYEDEAD